MYCLTVMSDVMTTQCCRRWITHVMNHMVAADQSKVTEKLLSPFFLRFPCKFFLTAPANEFFRLPGCYGSGCQGLPPECWALEGVHNFSDWGILSFQQKTGLRAGRVWPPRRLTVTLVSPCPLQRFWMTPGSPSRPGLKTPHSWAPRRRNMKSTSTGARMSVLR